MTDKKKFIDDEDRSTEGGPQHGLGFIIILGSVALIAVVALVIILFTGSG